MLMQTKTAHGARKRFVTLFSIAIAVCAVAWSGRALCDTRWQNHVDPSLIREIVYRDGELFMATSGGIVIYNLACFAAG